ncbi:hypothetical protein JCM18905_5021 [Vibrio sp. JCM 18905]|nr:hypothetical protein JCM18905_5021 [Vibrio sp. JCM 18905]
MQQAAAQLGNRLLHRMSNRLLDKLQPPQFATACCKNHYEALLPPLNVFRTQ